MAAHDIRAALLPFTIRNALGKSFYRWHWKGRDAGSVTAVADLPSLPTVTNDEYREGFMLDFEDPGDSHYVSHTTGTTGELTWRHRTIAEAAAVDHLFSRAVAARAENGVPSVALVVERPFHGTPFPVPGHMISVPGTTAGDQEVLHCLAVLRTKFRVHGRQVTPSVILGPAGEIALLAQALYERSVDPASLGIKRVYSSFAYLDSGLRRFIESAFGCTLTERYTLSEILGGATYDATVDALRLDPWVVGEVVDEHGEPVPPGRVGELTLTELFPLVQMQPLVRFRTGDVVERVEAGHDLAFRWWGRRHESLCTVEDGIERWLFGYRHVVNLLADEPSVARLPVRPHLSTVKACEVGHLALELEAEEPSQPARGSLRLRLRHPPRFHAWATTELIERIWAELGSLAGGATVSLRVTLEHSDWSITLPERALGAEAPKVDAPRGA